MTYWSTNTWKLDAPFSELMYRCKGDRFPVASVVSIGAPMDSRFKATLFKCDEQGAVEEIATLEGVGLESTKRQIEWMEACQRYYEADYGSAEEVKAYDDMTRIKGDELIEILKAENECPMCGEHVDPDTRYCGICKEIV